MQHLQSNTTLQGGKYRIERVLGQGGFGITYLASFVSSNRQVAIKELFIGGSGQAINDRRGNQVVVTNSANQQSFNQQKAKFKKEALRLANLNHPNLVKVHEFFEENGTAYYVMDYIYGESLRTKLNREGKLSESLVLKYIKQILPALEVAHKQSIWHLDIKPENIMVDRFDQAYLIDFGASKHIERSGTLTTSLALAYTPGYCAPELTDLINESEEGFAEAMREIGPWTDIYSVGATMYSLLTDNIPPSSKRIERNGRNAFSFSSDASLSTQDLIIWMMRPNREDRPQVVRDIHKRQNQTKKDDERTLLEENYRTGNITPSHTQSYVNSPVANTTVTESNSNSMIGWIMGIAVVVIIALTIWLFSDNSSHTIPAPPMTTDSIEEIADIAPEDASSIRMEGNDYYYGWNGKSVNYTKAVELYQKAANMDDAEAQYNLGNAYESGVGIEKDYKESVKWYKKSANQGNVSAQSHLGAIYKFGEVGVVQNYDEALKWLKMAANKDDVMAQVLLGDMYNFGEGVEVDYTEAVRWYNKAALQGNSHAQSHLGLKYSNGQGVMKDATEAVKWFRKAAEQGNADAQRHLGYAYYKGEGVDKNYTEAYKWLKKAADKNNSWALYYLGYMYLYAEGVQQDFDEAYLMFKRSADLGHKDSQGMLKSRDYWPTMFNLNK